MPASVRPPTAVEHDGSLYRLYDEREGQGASGARIEAKSGRLLVMALGSISAQPLRSSSNLTYSIPGSRRALSCFGGTRGNCWPQIARSVRALRGNIRPPANFGVQINRGQTPRAPLWPSCLSGPDWCQSQLEAWGAWLPLLRLCAD